MFTPSQCHSTRRALQKNYFQNVFDYLTCFFIFEMFVAPLHVRVAHNIFGYTTQLRPTKIHFAIERPRCSKGASQTCFALSTHSRASHGRPERPVTTGMSHTSSLRILHCLCKKSQFRQFKECKLTLFSFLLFQLFHRQTQSSRTVHR